MRVLARIVFLFVVLLLLVVCGVVAWLNSWKTEHLTTLAGASSIVETKAGPVEVLQEGDGPAVLVFHGSPGGFDQAMLLGADLAENGYQVLAPSRPGYLRTSLSVGRGPEREAEAMVGLLDSLGVDSVAVVAFSLGTPAAMEFVRKFPGRVWAFVLISPIARVSSGLAQRPPFGSLLGNWPGGSAGEWLLSRELDVNPAGALAKVFDATQSGSAEERSKWAAAVMANPLQMAWVRDFLSTLSPLQAREAGWRNDLTEFSPEEDFLVAGNIPTLIVHGAKDCVVRAPEMDWLAARFPRAERFEVPDAGHLPQLGAGGEGLDEKVRAFLGRLHGGEGTP